MSDWEKERHIIAELKTDVHYIREDIQIMQKQIRDLNQTSNIGVGFSKATIYIGTILGSIYTLFKFMD